ncbi:ubiquitin-like small modifier protein 1 [Haladaptatus sp. NG-WS-4]
MQLTVYGPLRGVTGSKTVTLAFDGGSVEDALSALVERYPRARKQLFTDGETLRPSVRLSVDGDRADLDDDCPPDAELTVFPAMRGG